MGALHVYWGEIVGRCDKRRSVVCAREAAMATIPVRLAPRFPDTRDYPQSGNRTMPSTRHERAQRTAAMLLEAVVAPDDGDGNCSG